MAVKYSPKFFGICLLLAMGCACAQGSATGSRAIPEWRSVLYDLYQNRPLAALTRIRARESRNEWSGEILAEAIAAEAALYAELGLPEASAHQLARLDAEKYNTEGFQRLQLLMTQQYFVQGKLAQARAQLEKLPVAKLSPPLAAQWYQLKGQIDFAQGQYEAAAAAFAQTNAQPEWLWLGYYNQAISLLHQNKSTEALNILQPLLSAQNLDDKGLTVRDKSWTALGWYALQQNQPKAAIQYLKNVRQHSPESWNAALLLGWAFAQDGDYKNAIRIWSYLSEQADPLHPAVQEAWLALPYARQQLGDIAGALSGYQAAQTRVTKALATLDRILSEQRWLAAWDNPNLLVDAATASLVQYLSQDAQLTQLVEQWSQLSMWQDALISAKARIPVLQWAVAANEARFQTQKVHAEQRLTEMPFDDLEQAVSQLVTENNNATTHWCDLRRISAKLREACQRLQRATALLKTVPTEKRTQYQKRLNRVQGVLYWQIAWSSPLDQWHNKKAIRRLQQAYSELQQRHQRLQQLTARQRPPIDPVLKRLDLLLQQTNMLAQQLQAVETRLNQRIFARANRLAEGLRTALVGIQRQAQLAIARLRYFGTTENVQRQGDGQ